MAKDASIQVPLTDFVREVALTAGGEAAHLAINEHIQLCEARKAVLADGNRPGMSARMCVLEKSQRNSQGRNPWRGFWVRVAQTVVAAAILGVLVFLLFLYRVQGN